MTRNHPTVDQCVAWIEQYEMLDNIRAHSFVVAQVAETILDHLQQYGMAPEIPDRDLVIAGALLHDIAKTLCIQTGCHHAKVGQQICTELGQPEIGKIVAEHVTLSSFNEPLYRRGIFSATELVYYADKRVMHDRVVELPSRLSYIIERYGRGEQAKEQYIRQNFKQTTEFEYLLFQFIDFTPGELPKKMTAKSNQKSAGERSVPHTLK